MRFGQKYHRLQVPLWSSSYFKYNTYKGRVRAACIQHLETGEVTQYEDLVNTLCNDINAFILFCSKEYKTIQVSQTHLFDLEATFDDSRDTISLDQVVPWELKDLLIAFTELRSEISKLLWFVKVTEEGLRKIHVKIQRACRDNIDIIEGINANLSKIDSYLAIRQQCFTAIRRIDHSIRNLDGSLLSKRTEKLQLSLHLHFYLGEACSAESLKLLQDAIKDDDAYRLEALYSQTTFLRIGPIALLPPLLLWSLLCRSPLCFRLLLTRLEKLGDDVSIDRSVIHRLTILTASRGAANAARTASEISDEEDFVSEDFMKCILAQLKNDQRSYLYKRDSRGRLPIHYASQYGQSHVCQLLADHMLDGSIDTTLCSDIEGNSPLSLAIANGHAEAVNVLLMFHRKQSGKSDVSLLPGSLLEIALNFEYQDIIASLLAAGVDETYRNEIGETLIYTAARAAHKECLIHLLRHMLYGIECLNIPESTYGRTPLMVASLLGYSAITELLINAGANVNAIDYFAWTAGEIAAYQGHIEVLQLLEAAKHVIDKSSERTFKGGRKLKGLPSIGNRRGSAYDISKQSTIDSTDDMAHLFVSFGSLDPRNSSSAADLSSYNNLDGVSPQTSTVFALGISVVGETATSNIISLPVLEDVTNNPCWFSVRNSERSILSIQVFHLGSCVGNGIGLIPILGQELGLVRQSLVRDFTVPIIETKSSRFIGTVTCTAVVSTPYGPPKRARNVVTDLWRTQSSTKVAEHRGSGENFDRHDYLQIKENSVQSFNSALNVGASALEFDVQVTKDHVAVLYHDFRMSETGIDAPVHAVTFEQLLSLSKVKTNSGVLSNALIRDHLGDDNAYIRQRRSRSVFPKPKTGNRLQGLKKYQKNDLIEEPYVTLEGILQQIPETVPFDVELKYPMLSEAVDRNMEASALELNAFVDIILDKLYRHAGNREIIISSFSPEICVVLQAKQQIYPVCFLNDAGFIRYGDKRASSIQNAIRFAKRWNLHGVVIEARSFVSCPRLIKFVKGHGLFCASFGGVNNDPESAKVQVDAGLDVIIVDRVNVIVDSLKKDRG